MKPGQGRLVRLVVRFFVPPDRREEFIGDLIEEAVLHDRRRGDADAWIVRQLLFSAPSLLWMRLRRTHARKAPPAPVAVVTAVSGEEAQRAFGLFLASAHANPRG